MHETTERATQHLVPDLLLDCLDQIRTHDLPFAFSRHVALLWIDIVGSTRITNYFAQQGPDGVQNLTEVLNNYYRLLTDAVYEVGGDVVAFAGDALVCIWPAAGPDVRDAAFRAATCATAARDALAQLKLPELGERGYLEASMSVTVGQVDVAIFEDADGRRHFVLDGEALATIKSAPRVASAEEILLSDEAYTELEGICDCRAATNGWRILEKLSDRAPLSPVHPRIRWAADRQAVGRFLSPIQAQFLGAASDDQVAEFRRTTLLFVRIGKPFQTRAIGPNVLQEAFTAIGRIAKTYGGVLDTVHADDKGTVSIIAFGLPNFAHEDDSWRGASAAMEILKQFSQANDCADHGTDMVIHCGVGVATGSVFCGYLGGRQRGQYTFIGDAANLSARLMQAADDTVLCDEATYQAASNRIKFDRRRSVRVKGLPDSANVYTPKGEA